MAKGAGGSGRSGGGNAVAYTSEPARYAKGKIAVRPSSQGDYRSNASYLAEAVGGRYSNRERAYIMSPSQVRRMDTYLRQGMTANPITGEIYRAALVRRRR